MVPSVGLVGLGESSPWCRSIKQLGGNYADYSCINWKKEKLWRRLRLLISLLTQVWSSLQAKSTLWRAFLQHSCDYCNNKPRQLILSQVKQGDVTVFCMPVSHLLSQGDTWVVQSCHHGQESALGKCLLPCSSQGELPLGWKFTKSHPCCRWKACPGVRLKHFISQAMLAVGSLASW